jgi:hypothetical protein
MKQQLYIKNDKGRFEPYKEPTVVDNSVYRKFGNKYEPMGRIVNEDYLTEGVWVVYNNGYTNGKYLRNRYELEKASDLQYPEMPLATLGGLQKAIDTAIHELYSWKQERYKTTGVSEYDCYEFVVMRVMEILKENSNGNK